MNDGPTPGNGRPKRAPARRSRIAVLVATMIACAVAIAAMVLLTTGGGREPKSYRYVIPAGTQARLDAGEKLNVVPSRLVVHVGDHLLVRNRDSVPHHVGALYVDANGLIRLDFGRVGTIRGLCTLNQEGSAAIVVKS